MKRVAGRKELTFSKEIADLDTVMQYEDFKALVIAEVFGNSKISEPVLEKYGLKENPNFDKFCSDQLKSGSIFEKMLTVSDNSLVSTDSEDENVLNEDELEEMDATEELKGNSLDDIDDEIDF